MLQCLAALVDESEPFALTPISDEIWPEAVLARRSDLAGTLGMEFRDHDAATGKDASDNTAEHPAGIINMVERYARGGDHPGAV